MKVIEGIRPIKEGIRINDNNQYAEAEGFVHRVRDMGKFSFIVLRTSRNLIQCVVDSEKCEIAKTGVGNGINEGDCVRITGIKVIEPRAEGGFEIHANKIEKLSQAYAQPPVNITKHKIDSSLDVLLENRPVTLRHPKERAIFKIQEGIVRAFREFLHEHDFTEIHTPKTTSAGAEGGANIFKLDYFGQSACLAQSPQLYKQTMVGVFGRVFEVGPVFRAEKHNTTRHLNEYISLDVEMGFINGMEDLMNLEVLMLRHIIQSLKENYSKELDMLKAELPDIGNVPVYKFKEAKELLAKEYNRKIGGNGDLDPEEEVLLCRYAKEKHDSEFIFITHFPSSRRPFYAMDDADDPGFALSFDLLFRGLEITTGGQRIHDYNAQVEKMQRMGLDPSEFKHYLLIHKHGMPPHGGFGLGLERLEMQLLGFNNIRYASLFPRDVKRIAP
ncbi:MAG: aspartate--tRNA(Asn) ligase [Clostridiaceae bacterium]|nr:aspartate--tRNA(Asn) ligase [Clostridiaceae bacterium]